MKKKQNNIISLVERNLSFYRTLHNFQNYAEFHTVSEFSQYVKWANERNIKIYILGNGSNTLFTRKRIRSLILKNKLEKETTVLSNYRLKVSSSVLVIDILKYCFENSLSSFYYLASVPATIGGALAMNAGRGYLYQKTIYDFVESVTFFDPQTNCIKTLGKNEIVKGYRETIFTGVQSQLILDAVFKFSLERIEGDPIAERCRWSKENQDYSGYNCGSVFKQSDKEILTKLRGLKLGEAYFSNKVNNWITNKADNHFPILCLITIARFIHLLKRRIAKLEIILVD